MDSLANVDNASVHFILQRLEGTRRHCVPRKIAQRLGVIEALALPMIVKRQIRPGAKIVGRGKRCLFVVAIGFEQMVQVSAFIVHWNGGRILG